MSRVSEFRLKYGVIGAGAVSKSLIARLPAKARQIGPVAGVSFRVASRIANTLCAGHPVRDPVELNSAHTILFLSPPEQAPALLELLEAAPLRWPGKSLIFCDYNATRADLLRFEEKGASTAVLRHCGVPGCLSASGSALAMKAAQRIALDIRMNPIEIAIDSLERFDAAVTLGTAALTPLIDAVADVFRQLGARDVAATRMAAGLFHQTIREYSHSGKQSWAWYTRRPDSKRIEAEIAAAGDLGPVLRQLLLLGLETLGKHPDFAALLRKAG